MKKVNFKSKSQNSFLVLEYNNFKKQLIILINKISRQELPLNISPGNEWVVIIFENILIDFVILPDN